MSQTTGKNITSFSFLIMAKEHLYFKTISFLNARTLTLEDNPLWLIPLAIALASFLALLPKWLLKIRLMGRQTNMVTSLLPPGPEGFPLLGYLPYLGPDLHRMFMELAQVYGPIYKLSIGRRLCVIISSPSLVEQVVRDQDIVFANRNPSIASLAFSFGGNDIAFAVWPSVAFSAQSICSGDA